MLFCRLAMRLPATMSRSAWVALSRRLLRCQEQEQEGQRADDNPHCGWLAGSGVHAGAESKARQAEAVLSLLLICNFRLVVQAAHMPSEAFYEFVRTCAPAVAACCASFPRCSAMSRVAGRPLNRASNGQHGPKAAHALMLVSANYRAAAAVSGPTALCSAFERCVRASVVFL